MSSTAASCRPPRPRISVVTVCFNAMAALPPTVASLKAQTTSELEWVVVDGASRDGTAQWLVGQRPDVLVSEPDHGIFDAMNKALGLARGDWIYFLNAGDALADPQVLADVLAAVDTNPGIELLYGDVLYQGACGQRQRRFHWLTQRRLLFGDLCHQAAFARRELFVRCGGFDTALRWNADFDWFLRVFAAGTRMAYLPRTIARFDDAGAHVQAAAQSLAERNAIRSRRLPLWLWRGGNLALRVEHRVRRWMGQSI